MPPGRLGRHGPGVPGSSESGAAWPSRACERFRSAGSHVSWGVAPASTSAGVSYQPIRQLLLFPCIRVDIEGVSSVLERVSLSSNGRAFARASCLHERAVVLRADEQRSKAGGPKNSHRGNHVVMSTASAKENHATKLCQPTAAGRQRDAYCPRTLERIPKPWHPCWWLLAAAVHISWLGLAISRTWSWLWV